MSPEGLMALAVAERFVAGEATGAEREAFNASGTAMSEAINLRTHEADYCAHRLVQLAAQRNFRRFGTANLPPGSPRQPRRRLRGGA